MADYLSAMFVKIKSQSVICLTCKTNTISTYRVFVNEIMNKQKLAYFLRQDLVTDMIILLMRL